MAISATLRTFLNASKVTYTTATHPAAYTAQELAAAQHVSGRQVAKCVLVKTERGPALAVLPASALIHCSRLRRLLRARTLTLAKEPDIHAAFPDLDVGSMSPFGHLYGIPVVLDRALAAADTIVFNAGSHTHTITMRSPDLIRLASPTLGDFGQSAGAAPTPSTRRAASPRHGSRVGAARSRAKTVRRPSPPRRRHKP
jgi:Ala-tRNA(Pro) deacylase